jgi:hypothetical protein
MKKKQSFVANLQKLVAAKLARLVKKQMHKKLEITLTTRRSDFLDETEDEDGISELDTFVNLLNYWTDLELTEGQLTVEEAATFETFGNFVDYIIANADVASFLRRYCFD